jgi:hypothetical protein
MRCRPTDLRETRQMLTSGHNASLTLFSFSLVADSAFYTKSSVLGDLKSLFTAPLERGEQALTTSLSSRTYTVRTD